ncbi:insulinase family protein [Planctomicrobium sp.]|nr:insulinase family protein [Planctomicrobium sp.]MDB4731612.1 insulinase family protein [bacterium]
MRVVTEAIPSVRSASICVLVSASPQDEPEDKGGLAHFTDHAHFQGTSNRNSTAIAKLIDESGGQLGGFTGRDYTCSYANVMDDNVTIAIDLLGDILLNSTFPEQNLARAREAIVHEIVMSLDYRLNLVHQTIR